MSGKVEKKKIKSINKQGKDVPVIQIVPPCLPEKPACRQKRLSLISR
jgi:hypothetical protein